MFWHDFGSLHFPPILSTKHIILYMKSTKTAYLLWILGIFGCLGLHQFYLRKHEKGILYILTLGGFGMSTLLDLFRMSNQVKSANSQNNTFEIISTKPLKEREVWVDLYQYS
jgi:TM2 domain-containing membrane protein YozV